MRCAPASQFRKQKSRSAPVQLVPRKETKTREVFDLLQSSKGCPVEFEIEHNSSMMTRLIDFYGLDIRIIQRGYCSTGRKCIYVLAGEWFGKVYVDYIAEHLASLKDREAA